MLITHPPCQVGDIQNLASSPGWCKRKSVSAKETTTQGAKPMKPNTVLVILVAVFICCTADLRTSFAQQLVHFPSLEDNGIGQPGTMLDADALPRVPGFFARYLGH